MVGNYCQVPQLAIHPSYAPGPCKPPATIDDDSPGLDGKIFIPKQGYYLPKKSYEQESYIFFPLTAEIR